MNPIKPKTIDLISSKVDDIKGAKNFIIEVLDKVKQQEHEIRKALDSINVGVAGGNVPDDDDLDASFLVEMATSARERIILLRKQLKEYGEI